MPCVCGSSSSFICSLCRSKCALICSKCALCCCCFIMCSLCSNAASITHCISYGETSYPKHFFGTLPAIKHTLEFRQRKGTETPSLQIEMQPSIRSIHGSTNSLGLKHKSRSKSNEPQFTMLDDETEDDMAE
eukprot:1134020_1